MKYVLIIALWFVVLSNVLWAKSYVIQYEIYDDSNVTRVFEVKKELFKQYDTLVDRVDNIYVGDLLEKEYFIIENSKVTYKDYVVERIDFAVVELFYMELIVLELAAIYNASSNISKFINNYNCYNIYYYSRYAFTFHL